MFAVSLDDSGGLSKLKFSFRLKTDAKFIPLLFGLVFAIAVFFFRASFL